MEEHKPNEKVIQTYVWGNDTGAKSYLVSTIHRQSSAIDGGMFYEIFGWELNPDKSKGDWILEDAAYHLKSAIDKHQDYCKRLALGLPLKDPEIESL